jgi:transglutaminase-like putative cysteine protease
MFHLLAIGLSFLPQQVPEQPLNLDPGQPYIAERKNPIRYTAEFKAIVTAPQGTKKLRVWIPIPQSDHGQEVTACKWSTFPQAIVPTFHTENVFGNRFAYFEFDNPQGAQIITHHFNATIWELNWGLKTDDVIDVKSWPDSFRPYQRSERAIVINDKFKTLANELAQKRKNRADKLVSIMDWTHKNLTYDHSTTSLIGSSEHAFTKKRGDCSDYHGLCSSLGRALGVPTRVTYGLHLFPKNSPSHCKLEAFLPPYGWVSFDVSETQKLVRAIEADTELSKERKATLTQKALRRLEQGFRDNCWLIHSKGTDYDVAPKGSGKVPLIATIYGEADGKALPLPDPADKTKREFSWMTAHRYQADKKVDYPFRDFSSLEE